MELFTLSCWKWNPERSFENTSQTHVIPLFKNLWSLLFISQRKPQLFSWSVIILTRSWSPTSLPLPHTFSPYFLCSSPSEFAVLQTFPACSLGPLYWHLLAWSVLFSDICMAQSGTSLNVTFPMIPTPTGPFKLHPHLWYLLLSPPHYYLLSYYLIY